MSAPPGSRRWPLAVSAFGLGSLFTAVLAAGLSSGVPGCGGPPPGTPAGTVRPRPEFTRLVMGKGEAEVVAAVGPPDSTSEDDGTKFWHYKGRTRDPLTGATDTDVQVIVQQGKVVAVNY